MNMNNNGGIIDITTEAAISPYRIAYAVTKRDAATLTVAAFLRVSINAKRYSFQLARNVRIDTANIPGKLRGKMMLKINLVLEQPSINAASSNSMGMSLMKLLRTRIDNGRLNTV
jgi:hypothetical protein